MKIRGVEVNGPNRVVLVLPRQDSEDVVIEAVAVTDLGELDEILVKPEPPVVLGKGQEKVKNFKDPGYIQQLNNYNLRRLAYIVIKSLEPSEIEWDRVDLQDPSTWLEYVEEFKEAGFSQVEINLIGNAVMEANALDNAKLEEARKVFLRGRAVAAESSGQATQAPNS